MLTITTTGGAVVLIEHSSPNGKLTYIKDFRLENNGCKVRFLFTKAKKEENINPLYSKVTLSLVYCDENLKTYEDKGNLTISPCFVTLRNEDDFMQFPSNQEIYDMTVTLLQLS